MNEEGFKLLRELIIKGLKRAFLGERGDLHYEEESRI